VSDGTGRAPSGMDGPVTRIIAIRSTDYPDACAPVSQ
jgi:hypothetical protein